MVGLTKSQEEVLAKVKASRKPEVDKTESFIRGLGDLTMFGFYDEASAGLAAGVTSALDLNDKSYSENYDEMKARAEQQNKEAFDANPLTYLGSGLAGGAVTGGAALSTKAGQAAANSLRTGNLAARTVKAGVAGAPAAMAYRAGSAQEGDRVDSALDISPLDFAGAVIPASGAALSGVKSTILPKIDDVIKPLAKRAKQFGIPLRMDQVSPSRVRRTIQKVSQEIPFSGVDKFEDTQRKAFTKAVAKTIGQDADDLRPEVIDKFLAKAKTKFDSVLKGNKFQLNQGHVDKVDEIRKVADELLTKDISEVVGKQVNKFLADIPADGLLKGEKLGSLRSTLINTRSKITPQAREYVGELIEVIDSVVEDQVPKKAKKMLASARKEWRNYRTIEPLLEEATDGMINPVKLMQRVKSSKFIKASRLDVGDDDLVDLARIGKQFLPKNGGSDTFQKSALGLAGAAGVVEPTSLLATVPTMAANRGAQAINQSQKLVNRAVNSDAVTDAIGLLPAAAEGGAAIEAKRLNPKNLPSGLTSDQQRVIDSIKARRGQEQSSVPADLIQDEGKRLAAYQDTTGHTTVGIGFNMDSGSARGMWKRAGVQSSFDDVRAGRASISEQEAQNLVQASYQVAAEDARNFIPSFNQLTQNRQEAVMNLSYQLGANKLGEFKTFKKHLMSKKYALAARALINSKWYDQTQESRRRRVIQQIMAG